MLDASAARRGAATINALYGNTLAVLTGDYLFGKSGELVAGLDDPAIIKYFRDQGAGILQGYSGEKLRKFIDAENAKYKDLVERAGVEPA